MLAFDPSHRLSVNDALAHPYLCSVRNEVKETVATAPMSDETESKGEDPEHLHGNVRLGFVAMFLCVEFFFYVYIYVCV